MFALVRFDEHKRTRHEGKVYRCDECEFMGTSAEGLKIHVEGKGCLFFSFYFGFYLINISSYTVTYTVEIVEGFNLYYTNILNYFIGIIFPNKRFQNK